MTFVQFEKHFVEKTEAILAIIKRKRLRKAARKKKLPIVLDWIISIIVIIFIVILINMFIFQNYRIPSPSMVPTLMEGDLIFVEKTTFGPEILPGAIKLPARRTPVRGEVVSFESTKYAQDGPLLEFVYRFVYFITLSRVNLKTDESGDPIVDLLIKRVIGIGGDTIRDYQNGIEIKPEGETDWISEARFFALNGRPQFPITGGTLHPRPKLHLRTLALYLQRIASFGPNAKAKDYIDMARSMFEQNPDDADMRTEWLKKKLGYYVPHGFFFPMGDNREHSFDARDYGPVELDRIQGKALFRFFPFNRLGAIE
jgi:signal peptidase I